MSRFCHLQENPREFNFATLFFAEVNISPHPSIVPSLSEIRDLSIITPLPGSLMDTLLSHNFKVRAEESRPNNKQCETS